MVSLLFRSSRHSRSAVTKTLKHLSLQALACLTAIGAIVLSNSGGFLDSQAQAASPNSQAQPLTKEEFLMASAHTNSSKDLGQQVSTNYDTYCQPTYPPQEKPACLLGVGDKLPEGSDLGTVQEVSDSEPDLTAMPTIYPLQEPLVLYQYDKAILYPR